MLQYSKILRGRDEWKAKAIVRGNDCREYRKTLNRYRQRVSELDAQVKRLKAANTAATDFSPKN